MIVTVRVLYILLADRLKSDYMNLINELGAKIKTELPPDDELVRERLFLEAHQSEAFEMIDSFDWENEVDEILEGARENVIEILKDRYPGPESPDKEARVPDHDLRIKALATLIQDYVVRMGGKVSSMGLPIQEARAIYNKMMKEG